MTDLLFAITSPKPIAGRSPLPVRPLFSFHAGARAILLPQYDPGASPDQGGPAEWMSDLPAGSAAPAGAAGRCPPSSLRLTGALGLAGRVRAGRRHAALGLAGKSDSEIYRFRFPHPDEEAGRGEVQPKSSLPWSTPWRVLIVSDGWLVSWSRVW